MLSQVQTQPKPPKHVHIDTWEGEGGATATVVFGRPRPLHRRAMTRIECIAYKLTRRVRAHPLQTIALALGVGLVLGAGVRGATVLNAFNALKTVNDLTT